MKLSTFLTRAPVALLAAVTVSSCVDDHGPTAPLPRGVVPIGLELSSRTASPGDRIAVAIRVDADPGVVGAIQGALHYDATRLRYVGQAPEGKTITLVNDSEAGRLRLASFSPTGIQDRVAHFVFEVRGAGFAEAVRYEHQLAATTGTGARSLDVKVRAPAMLGSLGVRGEARRMTALDWAALDQPTASRAPIAARPGEYRLNLMYGDVDYVNGIGLFDVVAVANAAIGNDPMIAGTDGPPDGPEDKDLVIAGNVAPTDAGCGLEPDGSRVLNIFDVLAIANEVVGNSEACVGDIIPGRGPVATTVQSVTTTSSPDLIIASGEVVTFTSDRIWQLEGVLRVRDGGVLNVQAGTTVQGLTTATESPAIFVERGGTINAVGTVTQPVLFTCTPAPKFKGCWGGIFIAGKASVNLGEDLGYTPPFGGNQRRGEGGAADYGGNLDNDNSGTLRYVVIEYGGKIVEANRELNGLTLGGVGRGTTIEYVQIHGGTDDGIEFFGGTVNVKHLVLTGNDDDQFDISFGWNGDAQFVIAQADAGDVTGRDSKAIEADNTETATLYNATPRTSPRLFNFTLIGNLATQQDDGAIQLRRGNGAQINNFLVIGYPIGLDLVDGATCDNFGGTPPSIRSTTFIDVATLGRTGETDVSGNGCPAIGAGENLEVLFINAAGNDNRTRTGVANVLVDALNTNLPDWRMKADGVNPVEGGVVAPPVGSIFSAVNFRGAVGPAVNGGEIPFYSGWTRPFQAATTP